MKNGIIKLTSIIILAASLLYGQSQKVLSNDNVEISYETKGEGNPALVFIHGWSCDKSYWSEQVKDLSQNYKVVTVDLGGHGQSGLNRESWTIEKFGEDVASVVNNLKLEKVILVGHSMGGSVILEAAKLLKGKVVGLIGADTYQSFTDDWTTEQKEGYLKSFVDNFYETTQGFVKGMFPASSDSVIVKKIADDMSQAPPQVATSAMRNLFFYNPLPTLKEIDLPIISINCDLYPVAVEANKKVAKSFEVKMMNGVGHFLMIERPEEFNKLLRESVKELANN
jgi:pimeloyl-ACP methyl ester carboxylesterase